MNPNEFFKNNPDKKWKYLCFRFVGRSRRLEDFKKLHCPELILDKEVELIQKAYEEMREGCLMDDEYKSTWEHNETTNEDDQGLADSRNQE